ncbi:ribonuclease HII, partial [Candidatus Bathyarchaeota archaeon]|nr:ribonuclease HII [Candidatus Bathyarchaeota archaeon]NIV68367.1 ribonuclease HII [Candidatus Bathyarchaeota archaeon]
MTGMRIGGVDDAGRGAVIGPLVIAGVLVEAQDLSGLKDMGVKDSKLLSRNKRECLSEKVKALAVDWCIEKLSPTAID